MSRTGRSEYTRVGEGAEHPRPLALCRHRLPGPPTRESAEYVLLRHKPDRMSYADLVIVCHETSNSDFYRTL